MSRCEELTKLFLDIYNSTRKSELSVKDCYECISVLLDNLIQYPTDPKFQKIKSTT